jgi:putative flippase GtrA
MAARVRAGRERRAQEPRSERISLASGMGLDDSATARAVPPPPTQGRAARSTPPGRLRHPLLGQIVRFGIVGVLNTGIGLAVYKVAIDVGIPYPLASVLAYAVGAVNSYTLNRIWTFRAGAFSGTSFARWAVVQLVAVGINELVLVTLVEGLSVDRVVAQGFALVVASAVMFVLGRQWAFAHRAAGPRPATALRAEAPAAPDERAP